DESKHSFDRRLRVSAQIQGRNRSRRAADDLKRDPFQTARGRPDAVGLHPLGADDLGVVPVAGRVVENIAGRRVEEIEGKRFLVALESRWRIEIASVSKGLRNANFIDHSLSAFGSDRKGAFGPSGREARLQLNRISPLAVDEAPTALAV